MKIIAIANQKGGVGKTTTTLSVGASLARKGKKVLLIDLDSQGSLTKCFGIRASALSVNETIFGVVRGDVTLKHVIKEVRDNVDLVPCNSLFSSGDAVLTAQENAQFILREALEEIEGYDIVLLDCPPNLGIVTINAFTASQKIYVTVTPEHMAVQGVADLLNTVQKLKKYINPSLIVGGVILTRFRKHLRMTKGVLEGLEQHFGDILFNTKIRDNKNLFEAPSQNQTIFEYAPHSPGGLDYRKLTEEIIEREGL